MIKIENLNKYFYRHKRNEIHVINNTTLELENSGLVALIGPSGCGKTTLLNAIGGLDKVNKGKIFINGEKITKRCANKVDKIRNNNIGYIFQDYYLVDTLSVFDNVALVLKINGIKNKEEIKKRVNYVLEKVGMYRYRNRYANMLSGGERQRVGIARAIVKNPSIIIADEPTGNLDSKNSIEVMNIIKAISKDRLVILVTHETELAEFYASRLIQISDGQVVKDEKNEHTNDLDYRMDNKIYLKDIDNQRRMHIDDSTITLYSKSQKPVELNIVVQNGNIYIESKTGEKIEVIDNDSSIELVDDHYQKISKSIYEEYDFDFDSIVNKKIKTKYSSIFNPFTLLINGFRKVRDYPFAKKLLLIGFFASAMFITYSACSIFGLTNIKDEYFVSINKKYLNIKTNKINFDNYLEYEKNENIGYMMPGDSNANFSILFDDYYQSSNFTSSLSASLSDIELISKKDIIEGKFPENDNEVVLDKATLDNFFKVQNSAKQIGIKSYKDMFGRALKIPNMDDLLIVGVVDLESPSIYLSKDKFINILANQEKSMDGYYEKADTEVSTNGSNKLDYNLVKDDISLKKGHYPEGDYEVIVNEKFKEEYKLNKTIDEKVNDKKLKVVGYYTNDKNIEALLVSNNTIKYEVINNTSNITIYPKDSDKVLEEYKEKKLNISQSYEYSRKEYIESKKESLKSGIIASGIILLVSLIEIYLMIRSSFLSRIKEVGIYRAIGMKKKDIRKMFIGEIIAITTLASMVGVCLMSYIVDQLSQINFFQAKFLINYKIFIIITLFIYVFNLLIGLLPVSRVLRKTPAQILSRTDI